MTQQSRDRSTRWRQVCGVALAAVVILMIMPTRRPVSKGDASRERRHVVLIGASIGQAWNLSGWPDRAGVPYFTAESVAAWQFDKSDALEETLMRPSRKFHFNRTYFASLLRARPRRPDIVILKECSSYFPGEVDTYLQKLKVWTSQIRAKNIVPVLATVVPVTRSRSDRDAGKQVSLLEYNRQVRAYARQEGLALLDLETAVAAQPGSFLRDDFTSGDGSHLNAQAYAALDRSLRKKLCEMTPLATCQ